MFKRVLQSKWFTAAILALIGLLLLPIIKIIPSVLSIIRENKNLSQKLNEIKKADSEIKKLSNYLKSTAYLERQARLKLNYKKPDENVVFVYKNLYNQNPNDQTFGKNSTSLNLWRKIWDWFKAKIK